MVFESRLVKAWMTISVASLFLYSFAQLLSSLIGTGYSLGFGAFVQLFLFLSSGHSNWSTLFILGHAFAELGVIARFAGLTLALLVVYYVFVRGKTWTNVKQLMTFAVFLEGLFFLALLPTAPMLFEYGNGIFAASYFVQVLLTAPFLIVLSLKIRKSQVLFRDLPWRFFGLAFLGYVAALWVNNISRWVFLASIMNVQFLLTGTPSIAFLNAAVLLSSGLAFALAGFVYLLKRGSNLLTMKYFALSLALVGTHFLIYLVYSVLAGALKSVMLVETWTGRFSA